MKKIIYSIHVYGLAFLLCAMVAACADGGDRVRVDQLNDISYQYHYRNLDSTRAYATRALLLADGYKDGSAEAMNNIAFVEIAKMNYSAADSILTIVRRATDNQIELLVANVQFMRLCQRRSDSKNFYHYRQRAVDCIGRIEEDKLLLSPRQHRRVVYAQSEYYIVLSTYLYYMGQRQQASKALLSIDPEGSIVKDTAQLLAYYYNVGSGGMLTARSHAELMQSEFDYLMRCYLLSRQYRYPFWQANSLQAISEHIQAYRDRIRLMSDNIQEFDYLNIDQMSDSLLVGNLAQRSLGLFADYGDVYQTAGAWRTLSEAYRSIDDNHSALICLENALSKDTAVNSAPDLVASIREQLSIVYSAMDDKPRSDYNRNIYLDLQDRTRQDRFLEARAEQLNASLRQLDLMIVGVMLLIVVIVAILVYSSYRHRRSSNVPTIQVLRLPFEQWLRSRHVAYEEMESEISEKEENVAIMKHKLERHRERNIEQRAKVWLASTITPLISRMWHEIKSLNGKCEDNDERRSRLEYVLQIADSIDESNNLLTRWIQLRQGDFMLHIESFRLQELFATLRKNSVNFKIHGVDLVVADTECVVKADRTLTLFMINTITDNARRYTTKGGRVSVTAVENEDYVEISIVDNGCGMDKAQLDWLFRRTVVRDSADIKDEGGHGFGLVNCKGIIEKYRKMSAIFNVCAIGAESEKGRGSRFYFRLPKGVVRLVVAFFVMMTGMPCFAKVSDTAVERLWNRANAYADSAYYSNVNGHYLRTIMFADSCLYFANKAYATGVASGEYRGSVYNGKAKNKLILNGDFPEKAAELKWYGDSVDINYGIILDVRNETAVAALALHRWGLYTYNNAVYTRLFRECSADNTLSSYIANMQRAESNRNIAIIILVSFLVAIFPAYYLLYYRRRMSFHLCVDRMNEVNGILLDERIDSVAKLAKINNVWQSVKTQPGMSHDNATDDGIDTDTTEGYYGFMKSLDLLIDDVYKGLADDIKRVGRLAERKLCVSDELACVSFDSDRLYISNNVLDNCLSSLKHETMYYPSRLKQLVVAGDTQENIEMLDELVGYYQLLYGALISQAVQILRGAGGLTAPDKSFDYLLAILKRKNGGSRPTMTQRQLEDGYVVVTVVLDKCSLLYRNMNPSELFSPRTPDVDFLVCCQIMRDVGEYTGARGCGISARLTEQGVLLVDLKTTTGVSLRKKEQQ